MQGGLTEVLYHLMSFGIPVDTVPVSASGCIKTKDFHKWINRRKKKEDVVMYYGIGTGWNRIDLPSLNDVLFAKGRPYQHHPGNQEYLRLIQECLKVYEQAPNRKEKRAVVWNLIDTMRDLSTRFLIKDKDDWWVEASEKEIQDKVIKAFSHALTSSKKKSNGYPVQIEVSPMGKRMRMEPRIGSDMPDDVPCLIKSCFLLGQGIGPSVRA